jgi:integrase
MPLLRIEDEEKPDRSLTPTKIAKQVVPPPKGKVVVYWVKGLGIPRGLGLLVRPSKPRQAINATWIMQADEPGPAGVTRRANIARLGELPFAEVVARGKDLRDQITAGENPNAARRRQQEATMAREKVLAFTLGEAVELYVRHLAQHGSQKRRPGRPETRVVETFRSEMKPLDDLTGTPLSELTRAQMAERHELMTAKNGPRAANKALMNVRAAWNLARARHPELPENILAGDKRARGFAYNAEYFGGKSIPWRDLPAWWAKVQALPNEIRRDLQVFGLLTGLRAGDAASVRWADLGDLDEGTLHRPNPKGGRRAAFTVPLARYVVELLKRRKAAQQGMDGGWVFPTFRARGGRGVTHIVSTTEQAYDAEGKKCTVLPTFHVLRRTFGSACAAAGIGDGKKNLLMNHRPRQAGVGDRYVNVDPDDLRQAIEDVVAFLLEKAGVPNVAQEPGEEKRDAG